MMRGESRPDEDGSREEHLHCDSDFYRTESDIYVTEAGLILRVNRRKMRYDTLIVLSGCVIKFGSGSFLNVDYALEPDLVNENQVFMNRKEKFIKFDTKDNNLEIELGISIPFIKVPLTASKHFSEAKESKITINAPGLIVAGMLMLTSFLVIPLLFAATSAPSDLGFGFQRAGKGHAWTLVEDLGDALSRSGIDSSSCVQKSICWMAAAAEGGKEGSVGRWLNYFLKSWWLSRLISGTYIEDAVQVASNGTSCGAAYSHCSFTEKHVQSFVKMMAAAQKNLP